MKNYSIENKQGICIIRTGPSPTKSDVISALQEISESEQPKLRLWDISNGFDLPTDELINISEYAKQMTTVPVKLAFVAPEDLGYGLTNMYTVFRQESTIDTNRFRSEAEAIAWLLDDN